MPSQPPLNVSAHNTSSTSVYVQWDAIPKVFIHGILLGYRVFYWKTSDPSAQDLVTLNSDQLDADLTSLEKFTEYCIQLVGFTRIGDGKKSECFNVTTDEDGEAFFSPEFLLLTGELGLSRASEQTKYPHHVLPI